MDGTVPCATFAAAPILAVKIEFADYDHCRGAGGALSAGVDEDEARAREHRREVREVRDGQRATGRTAGESGASRAVLPFLVELDPLGSERERSRSARGGV